MNTITYIICGLAVIANIYITFANFSQMKRQQKAIGAERKAMKALRDEFRK